MIEIIITIPTINDNNNNNMRREITAFLQQYGIFATLRRAFLPLSENYTFRNTIWFCAALYFSLTTSSRLSNEKEVQCKSNRLYFITPKSNCYPEVACFVENCSFCLDISSVTSLKRYVRS